MSDPNPLPPEQLRAECDPALLDFDTTQELPEGDGLVGQERALEALDFGVHMEASGYNLYLLGSPGVDRHRVVRRFLERHGPQRPTPGDICYVNNFKNEQKPRALELPAGRGSQLAKDMAELIEDLKSAIPAAFESEEYRSRRSEIDQKLAERQGEMFKGLQQDAERQGMSVLQTPGGFAIAPLKDGSVISREDFEKLPEEERKKAEKTIEQLSEELRRRIEQVPQLFKNARQTAKELDREVARNAVGPLLEAVKQRFLELENVQVYLQEVSADLVESAQDFRSTEEPSVGPLGLPLPQSSPSLHRYEVNVLVDNSSHDGAPVVVESNPSFMNLLGRVEHRSTFGNLVTDFRLIRPGALHRANGGYLVLDAERVLTHPFAWQGLRQALQEQQIEIESLDRVFSFVSTLSLEPDPVPLNVKVILIGSRLIYYLMSEYNDDFRDLFKVAVDFEDDTDRSEENVRNYARLIGTVVNQEKLTPFDRGAVARVIDQLSRVVSDSEKLSVHLKPTTDVLREADFWARRRSSEVVQKQDVEHAIEARRRRLDRVQRQVLEQIERETVLIDTTDQAIGQVNGLSVLSLGDFSFGRPSRITATARLGKGEVVDIERETKLGGSLHSKGVLILSSFLASRYAREKPLSLRASLVFEQSYGGVDGDSATVGEVCAILSALSRVPIKQALAVTGSMNQHGRVQAIGGVNEKIEGFFDVCSSRGLDGSHGVLIPADNVKHLMLESKVVEACHQGKFAIYPIRSIDEALGLLTGQAAGSEDDDGNFPEGSVNQRVAEALERLTRVARKSAKKEDDGDETESASEGDLGEQGTKGVRCPTRQRAR